MSDHYKPAAFLVVGDMVFQRDYPVELQHVRRSPEKSHVLLIWGEEDGEWCVLPARALVRCAGKMDLHHI